MRLVLLMGRRSISAWLGAACSNVSAYTCHVPFPIKIELRTIQRKRPMHGRKKIVGTTFWGSRYRVVHLDATLIRANVS